MNQGKRIHLVSYATGIFLHRQWFLGKSARANQVVTTVTDWTPSKLIQAGFQQRAPLISLESRGSGFWAWKPFIIEYHLSRMDDGDFLLYCDVGRRNNFKLLEQPLDPLIDWMEKSHQEVMPGLKIPWKGPMSMWTKRDAFVFTGMDTPEIHAASPIQASFSLWRACPESRSLATRWMDLCSEPKLVNDEKGLSNLPEFVDHRHDQSLLTLCCIERQMKGLDLGEHMPPIDTQHPCEVACWLKSGSLPLPDRNGRLIRLTARPLELAEKALRKMIHLG